MLGSATQTNCPPLPRCLVAWRWMREPDVGRPRRMNAFGPQPDSTELSDERLPEFGSDADPRRRSRPDGDVTTLSAPVPGAAPPGRARRAPWARIGLVVAAILVLTGGGAVALVSYFDKDPAPCA